MFTVWVGGLEVTDYLVGCGEALSIARYYSDNGYTDVSIERTN
jgi:hypothetical protein